MQFPFMPLDLRLLLLLLLSTLGLGGAGGAGAGTRGDPRETRVGLTRAADGAEKAYAVTFENADRSTLTLNTTPVHVTMLETMRKVHKMDLVVLGEKVRWRGFATRVDEYRRWMNEGGNLTTNDTFVLLFDSRDVIFQMDWKTTVSALTKAYHAHGDRIVLSTESWCCVRWLNNHRYIEPGMDRSVGCMKQYREFMTNQSKLAASAEGWPASPFSFINAGLMWGKVKNFKELFAEMEPIYFGSMEHAPFDDQAKMAQVFFRKPSMFWLDYYHHYFSNSDRSNSIWWVPGNGCFFTWNETTRSFHNGVFTYNQTTRAFNGTTSVEPSKLGPLVIHTSGKHWSCFNQIYNKLLPTWEK